MLDAISAPPFIMPCAIDSARYDAARLRHAAPRAFAYAALCAMAAHSSVFASRRCHARYDLLRQLPLRCRCHATDIFAMRAAAAYASYAAYDMLFSPLDTLAMPPLLDTLALATPLIAEDCYYYAIVAACIRAMLL